MAGIENPTCVFASTYGQSEQSFKLLQALALQEPVSPAAFSLSVHNAVAGLFSIIHNLTGTSLTICAGAEGIGAAFMEAVGLLNEGETENVLLICFEAPLPDAQKPYEVNPPTHMAACYLVTRSKSGAGLSLERVPNRVPGRVSGNFQASPFWQQMRDLIAFLESGQASLEIPCQRCTWRWNRLSDAS